MKVSNNRILSIKDNALYLGRNAMVTFNRTLRLPEDGKEYDLPAGFGKLPIKRIQDCKVPVPARWLNRPGLIIPLHQREAMFIEFIGANWAPSIFKVAVGSINVITSKQIDLKVKPHLQDYFVVPPQKYNDGVNIGNGLIKQYVAMPLNSGYTIESQLTDEDIVGGVTLVFYESKAGSFPIFDPVKESLAKALFEEQARLAIKNYGKTIRNKISSNNYSGENCAALMPARPVGRDQFEMGLAVGGIIKQQIFVDGHGADKWESGNPTEIAIHIVNSKCYEALFSEPCPPSPISPIEYSKMKIPWYTHYNEKIPSLSVINNFKQILGVDEIDKRRGITDDMKLSRLTPEKLIHIAIDKDENAVSAYVESAEVAIRNEDWSAAVQNATCALNMDSDNLTARHARAYALQQIGNHYLSYADSTKALQISAKHADSYGLRARSALAMQAWHLARQNVDDALAISPNHLTAARVLLNIGYRLRKPNTMLNAADIILDQLPTDREAISIREYALNLKK